MEKGLKVLLVASESAPFVKSGGLGDVVGSLPKALQKKNVDVRVVIPRHRVIKNETMYGVEFLGEFDVYLQWRKQRAKVLVTFVLEKRKNGQRDKGSDAARADG